jgi:hypothetical protein
MHDSAWGRLVGVLVSPVKTFESIARRPTWGVAFVVLVVLAAASGVLAWQRVDSQQMRESTREQVAARGQALNDEQLDQAVKFTQIVGYGCSAAMPAIAYLIAALALWGAFKVAGGEIGFPGSLAVTVHGMMPWGVAALLAVPVVLARGTVDYDQLRAGIMLASSAAALAPADASQVTLAVLSSLDVFSLWTIVLLAIGFAAAARVSRAKAAITVTVLWLLWVVVKVALAAVGDAFGGG